MVIRIQVMKNSAWMLNKQKVKNHFGENNNLHLNNEEFN